MSAPPKTTTAEQQELVRAACPGWDCWAVLPSHGPLTWSARPDGAPAATITGQPGPAELVAKITGYERDLARHLGDARRRLEMLPHSNVGRDEAAQLQALATALENLSARLTATGDEHRARGGS